jgi:hypothetical protein
MTFASTSEALDRLAPVHEFAPDWDDVLSRARVPSPRRRVETRRRLALVAALLVAIVVPLTAIAESRDWWFFSAGAPAPAMRVVVVKTGEWAGQRWELVAYRTVNGGLCFSMAPAGSNGRGAMNCDRVVGVTRESNQFKPRAITYLSSGPTTDLPGYIVGAVTDAAEEVAVYFIDGRVLRTETFAAPRSLGAIRFYAGRLPALLPGSMLPAPLDSRFLDKLVGYDRDGRVVACLNLPLPPAESVPLAGCP